MKPIIFGISGLHLTKEEKGFFTKNEVYGFILFKRNIQSQEQLMELVSELKALYPNRQNLFISTDQEGGRVARLKPPITEKDYPSAESFGKIYQQEGRGPAIRAVVDNYSELMQELSRFGIICPYAPVADLRYDYTNDVIGDRSFGNDVGMVVELCKTAIGAIEDQGGIAVIKHMPGHGRATCDSHLKLPRVNASLGELNKTDFEVFRQLAQAAQYAMTAHIIFDVLDPDSPVTLSQKAINFIRSNIGFTGTLISDAIEMKALHEGVDFDNKSEFIASLASVAQQSLEAGCDLVLHCTGDIDEMIAIASVI